MSKYIKLEDAIEAYNQAVTLLVESEMEEFNLGDFTECSFNTTQIKLIARMIESLPTFEVSEDCISEFRDYQIEWLTAHCDIELEPVLEDLIVRFLKDTAEMFVKENAPSVVPNCSEKPNNCETCANGEGDIEACGYCRHGDLYEPKDEQSSIVDIVTCEECKRCKKGLVIERRADEQETIVNLCNRTKPPTMVSLDFYCKDGERSEE